MARAQSKGKHFAGSITGCLHVQLKHTRGRKADDVSVTN